VCADGVLGDYEALGDGGHRVAARDKLNDLHFARGEQVALLEKSALSEQAVPVPVFLPLVRTFCERRGERRC
jgi:hypothetical protein